MISKNKTLAKILHTLTHPRWLWFRVETLTWNLKNSLEHVHHLNENMRCRWSFYVAIHIYMPGQLHSKKNRVKMAIKEGWNLSLYFINEVEKEKIESRKKTPRRFYIQYETSSFSTDGIQFPFWLNCTCTYCTSLDCHHHQWHELTTKVFSI